MDRPHAMVRDGKRYYYAQDAQGNVTGLIDSTGALVQAYRYTPYGEALAAGSTPVVNPYQYKGREWDAEARLHFMRARYYDPQLGRFISEDPIGLAGGINPMAFVAGDPVNFADPTGEQPVCVQTAFQFHESENGHWVGKVICVEWAWSLPAVRVNGFGPGMGFGVTRTVNLPSGPPVGAGGSAGAASGFEISLPSPDSRAMQCLSRSAGFGLSFAADVTMTKGLHSGLKLVRSGRRMISAGDGQFQKYFAPHPGRRRSLKLAGARGSMLQGAERVSHGYTSGSVALARSLPDNMLLQSSELWDYVPWIGTIRSLDGALAMCFWGAESVMDLF